MLPASIVAGMFGPRTLAYAPHRCCGSASSSTTIWAGASCCRRPRILDLAHDPAGAPLKPGVFRTGFEYSDCRVDDARLVLLNARDAAAHGATIRTRTRAVAAGLSGKTRLPNARPYSARMRITNT
jgi:hypothetical protein